MTSCRDPDCIVCEPDTLPEIATVPHEREWMRWDSSKEHWITRRIRTLVRASRPHGVQETPLIEIAEEEVLVGADRSSPVVDGRDIVFLTVADAEWMLIALKEALAFAKGENDGA